MSELTAEELAGVSLFDNDGELYLVPASTWRKVLAAAEDADRLQKIVDFYYRHGRLTDEERIDVRCLKGGAK